MRHYLQGSGFELLVLVYSVALLIGCGKPMDKPEQNSIVAKKIQAKQSQDNIKRNHNNSKETNREYLQILRSKAATGDPQAQFQLGENYHHGFGFETDFNQAFKWYHLAAENGHVVAQNNLGLLHQLGLGAMESSSEALKWYLKAANHGHAPAQFSAAIIYLNGDGVQKNLEQALFWLGKAASQNYGNSASFLKQLTPK